MGQEYSTPGSETAFLYEFQSMRIHTRSTFVFDTTHGATFSNTLFGEGRSRRAYKGTYTGFCWSKEGDPCVVKEFKDQYATAKMDWDSEVRVLKKAKEFARRFNRDKETTRPIEYVWSDVWKVTRSQIGTPVLGEWCMVEDYLSGQWNKWNSNAGYVASTSTMSLHAFSHWTYAHSGGNLLVCDLQGVRYDDKYILTDPVICSIDEEYGNTDMGVQGMALFFSTHQCTSFCNQLPRPQRLTDLVHPLLQAEMHKLRSTSYSSVDKFNLPTCHERRIRDKLLSAPGLDTIAEEEEEDDDD